MESASIGNAVRWMNWAEAPLRIVELDGPLLDEPKSCSPTSPISMTLRLASPRSASSGSLSSESSSSGSLVELGLDELDDPEVDDPNST